MDWLPITAFVLVGIFLLIVEIIFVPGTTVVGILGFLSMGYGIFQSYSTYGNTVGTFTLIGSLLATLLLFYLSFKNRSWERFSLKTSIKSRVNEDERSLEVGMKGMTLSSLKPVGKALFEEDEMEVRSNGGFVEENVEIEVLRIEGKKIFVQPVK
jgi:membrane-bound ClpP family serine protease